MMQIFTLVVLFAIFCLQCLHQNPDFKIIIHFDESDETAAVIDGENRKVFGIGGTNYQS